MGFCRVHEFECRVRGIVLPPKDFVLGGTDQGANLHPDDISLPWQGKV